jgi:hypothetical protein
MMWSCQRLAPGIRRGRLFPYNRENDGWRHEGLTRCEIGLGY